MHLNLEKPKTLIVLVYKHQRSRGRNVESGYKKELFS